MLLILAILAGVHAGPPNASPGPHFQVQPELGLPPDEPLIPLTSNPEETWVLDSETGGYSHIKVSSSTLNFLNPQTLIKNEFTLISFAFSPLKFHFFFQSFSGFLEAFR